MDTENLTVPGNLDSLKAVREFVKRATGSAGIDKQRAYKLTLAVDEILANIVIHGYDEAGRSGDVEISYHVEEDRLRVDLYDCGIPYDPTQNDTPAHLDKQLEDRPIGGLGVYLARQGTDDFIYEFVNDRNHNTFIVNRAANGS
ncbi:MAG: ATP-binding protein [Chloroflexi bacterium]|nr:ATP-binding protein [Chloroflexota bacterium]